jgi:predicted Rdx family selenoprotein
MTDGDVFQAQIDGTTMWVQGRNGGNQGREIRVKYKILDIRPAVNLQHEREAAQ